jgi:excisionase family DNA binding protein
MVEDFGDNSDPLLKVVDVARRLNISRSKAYQLVKSGEIPTVHIGSKLVRVREPDLQEYILRSRMIERSIFSFDARINVQPSNLTN